MPKSRSLEFAVKEIVAAVADDHGLGSVDVYRTSQLDQDLGMDEVDVMEVIYRLEDRFSIIFPDDQVHASSTVANIIDCLACRLGELEPAGRLPQIANQPVSTKTDLNDQLSVLSAS
jgi:acyl carrier protein